MKTLKIIPVMGEVHPKTFINEAVYEFPGKNLFIGVGQCSGGRIPRGHVVIAECDDEDLDAPVILQEHFWKHNFRSANYLLVQDH